MTTNDLPKFIKIWSNVQGMFNKVPSDQTLKLIFQSLADFKIEDIERALALTLRTSKFAPTIADVVEQIKRMYGVDDELLKIKANKWYNALNADIDSYADIITDDPRAVFAFEQCFNTICEYGTHSAKSDPFDRKAFIDSYVNARGFDTKACCLGGFFHSNGRPRVRYIGDYNTCRKLAHDYYSMIGSAPRLPLKTDTVKQISNEVKAPDTEPKINKKHGITDLINALLRKGNKANA